MNVARRALINQAITILKGVLEEEQDSFDSMPEGLQESERGQNSQDSISSLEEAIQNLQEIA